MIRRVFWQAVWFYRRKLRGARRIEGLVLDVGSGNAPYPRADVLAEKFLLDDSNRIGGQPMLFAGPVVVCDAEALPFRNNSFDYAVCSHLIEHVDHPDLVLSELSRVARAGYIECPNEDYDKLDTPGYHRWFASLDDGTLVLRQKSRATFDAGVKNLVHETLYADNGFWSAFWRHLDRFFVMSSWEGKINYRVEYLDLSDGSPGSAEKSRFDDPGWVAEQGFVAADSARGGGVGEEWGRSITEVFWKLLRRVARGTAPEIDWRSLVVCPVDHGELAEADEELACQACGRTYPIHDDVPVLISLPATDTGSQ